MCPRLVVIIALPIPCIEQFEKSAQSCYFFGGEVPGNRRFRHLILWGERLSGNSLTLLCAVRLLNHEPIRIPVREILQNAISDFSWDFVTFDGLKQP